MEEFVSVCGVHVGMNQEDAIKVLLEQRVQFGRNDSCIFTNNHAIFCGEKFHVRYELQSGLISRISLTWISNNTGKINTIKDERRIDSIYNKVFWFATKNQLYRFSENIEFEKGLRFKRGEYANLYNRIYLSAQYKTSESGLNAVSVGITSTYSDKLEPQVIDFLKSEPSLDKENCKRKKINYSINLNHIYKIAIIILIAVIGILFVLNNRYYYAKNGAIRIDKWKNERAILNEYGEYIKK